MLEQIWTDEPIFWGLPGGSQKGLRRGYCQSLHCS